MGFHHDNPWAQTSAFATAKLVELGYELLSHPPYSPDLAQCDLRLHFVSKREKVTRRAEIWVDWGGYRRHRGLLCRSPENVFFRRVKEVGASLGQLNRAKRRLCWEINLHFSKIFVLGQVLIGPPSYVLRLAFTKFQRKIMFPVRIIPWKVLALQSYLKRILMVCYNMGNDLIKSCENILENRVAKHRNGWKNLLFELGRLHLVWTRIILSQQKIIPWNGVTTNLMFCQ